MSRQQAYLEEWQERFTHQSHAGLPTHKQIRHSLVDPQEILLEARAYLQLLHQEHDLSIGYQARFVEVQDAIMRIGTYWHTPDELTYGARMGWRNSTRCIGRLHWKSLAVRDLRHLWTAEDIFEAIVEHLRLATNGGKIHTMMSVFAPQTPGAPGVRIWNPQVIQYAGYRQADGSVIGDPSNVEITEVIRQLGWRGGGGTPL